jgi:cutinase
LSGGSASGTKTMASMINSKVSQCPNTKIIAGGYSQGAQVAHNALATLPANVASHISAVVSLNVSFIQT